MRNQVDIKKRKWLGQVNNEETPIAVWSFKMINADILIAAAIWFWRNVLSENVFNRVVMFVFFNFNVKRNR